eukprot:1158086-Pelagomonas_calceolata.AAC.15
MDGALPGREAINSRGPCKIEMEVKGSAGQGAGQGAAKGVGFVTVLNVSSAAAKLVLVLQRKGKERVSCLCEPEPAKAAHLKRKKVPITEPARPVDKSNKDTLIEASQALIHCCRGTLAYKKKVNLGSGVPPTSSNGTESRCLLGACIPFDVTVDWCKSYKRALELSPSRLYSLVQSGVLHYQLSEFGESAAAFERSVSRGQQVYMLVAQKHQSARISFEVRHLGRKVVALALAPDYPPALLGAAETALASAHRHASMGATGEAYFEHILSWNLKARQKHAWKDGFTVDP